MIHIVILGTGNMATQLLNAFSQSEKVRVIQVVGRNVNALKKISNSTTISHNFARIAEADVYIIAVKDSAIYEVSTYLSHKKGIVVHTSGAMNMDELAAENRGVFYPLQTFTTGKQVDFASIPICIEARNSNSLTILQQIAGELSKKVYKINSEQRKNIHLAAVFINNFSNYLYYIGETLCKENSVPFELLHPLILETAQKVQSLSPREAQTGPARRGDKKSIQEHLSLLHKPVHTEIYKTFTQAIQQIYEEEL